MYIFEKFFPEASIFGIEGNVSERICWNSLNVSTKVILRLINELKSNENWLGTG